jgi:hypothetical protein
VNIEIQTLYFAFIRDKMKISKNDNMGWWDGRKSSYGQICVYNCYAAEFLKKYNCSELNDRDLNDHEI